MLEKLLEGSQINTTSVMARSAATLSHLLRSSYDWRFCQDWFYWLLLAGAGCRFGYDKTVLHDYRVHQDQLTRRDDLLAVRVVEPALVLLTGFVWPPRRRRWRRLRGSSINPFVCAVSAATGQAPH